MTEDTARRTVAAAETARPRGTFLTIQYLRAIAALMVVIHHARNIAPGIDVHWHYGAFAWGVDIFFVISGFIMGVAGTGDRPRAFITKRAIRIIPLYWIATLAAVLWWERSGVVSMSRDLVGSIVKSLLFIPHWSVKDPGQLTPYLVPGWTLDFEMFFYVLFFVGLLARRPLAVTATVLPMLVLAGIVFDPQGALGLTYTSPLLLEFLLGHLLAVAYMRRPTGVALWPLLPIGFAGLLSCWALPDNGLQMACRIVCATAVVAGALAIEGRAPYWSFGKLLGDASYSIYLTHTIIATEIAYRITLHLPLSGVPQMAVLVVLSLATSIAIGVATYRWVELPILRRLRSRLLPKKPVPVAA